MNTKNLCEEEITLAPQTEIFEEAKRIAAESAGAATDSFVMKYDANQKDFLIAVLTELGCTVTAEKDETNTMTATMNMEQLSFLINLECVKNIHKVLIRNHLEEEILAARAAEKEESAASVATPMMLSANEEEGVTVASVQTVAETAGSSMATAISLPLESWVDGCVCCPENDWIWYKFTVPSDAENTTYTVHTYGSLNMIGALCNSGGTVLASDNDGIKCKMVANLTNGATYYVKLKAYYQGETGGFHVRATTKTIVDSLSVVPQTIVLKTGVTYELPITIGEYSSQTDDTYPLVPITVSACPASPTETRVFWHIFDQNSGIEVCDGFYKIGKDETSGKDIYNKYTIVKSDENATATLYVYDWYQYGIRGTVNVFFTNEGGQVGRVNANNGLALRESAGDDGEVLGTLENRTLIAVVGETPVNEKWFHVYSATSDGSLQSGWCSGEFLETQVEYACLTSLSNWKVRSGAGMSYDELGLLRRGDFVKILAKDCATDGEYIWHKIVYSGSVGYVAGYDIENNNSPNFTFYMWWEALVGAQPPEFLENASETCLEFIRNYEGFSSTVYYDSAGYPTIGYGHVVKNGETFENITNEEALQLFGTDIAEAESLVTNCSINRNSLWKQQEFDAFVSLAFNSGNTLGSVMDDIIGGEDPYTAFSQASYDANNQFQLGLYRRRMDEADIFVNGEYTREYRAAPQG